MKKVNRKLLIALVCYGVLILAALYLLLPVRSSNESFILGVVLLVLAILIVKTIAHSQDDDDE
jgi:hypothetical protein